MWLRAINHLPPSTRQINLKVDDTFSPFLCSCRSTFLASDWKACTLSSLLAITLSTSLGRVSTYTKTLMVNFKLSIFSAFFLSFFPYMRDLCSFQQAIHNRLTKYFIIWEAEVMWSMIPSVLIRLRQQ